VIVGELVPVAKLICLNFNPKPYLNTKFSFGTTTEYSLL